MAVILTVLKLMARDFQKMARHFDSSQIARALLRTVKITRTY